MSTTAKKTTVPSKAQGKGPAAAKDEAPASKTSPQTSKKDAKPAEVQTKEDVAVVAATTKEAPSAGKKDATKTTAPTQAKGDSTSQIDSKKGGKKAEPTKQPEVVAVEEPFTEVRGKPKGGRQQTEPKAAEKPVVDAAADEGFETVTKKKGKKPDAKPAEKSAAAGTKKHKPEETASQVAVELPKKVKKKVVEEPWELVQHTDELVALRKRVDELKDDLEATLSLSARLSDKIEARGAKLTALLATATQQERSFKEAASKLDSEVLAARAKNVQKVDTGKNREQELAQQLEVVNSAVAELKKEFQAKLEVIDKLAAEIPKARRPKREDKTGKGKGKEQDPKESPEFLALKKKGDDLEKEVNSILQKLDEETRTVDAKTLSHQLAVSSELVNDLNASLSKTREELHRTQNAVENLSKQETAAKAELKRTTDELGKRAGTGVLASFLTQKLLELEGENSRLQSNAVDAALEAEVSALKTQVDAKKATNAQLADKVSLLEQQIAEKKANKAAAAAAAQPAPEEPKPEEPKPEEPKSEEPKSEEPKHEEPKHEEPKHDEPKHDEPKHDEPKHDDQPHPAEPTPAVDQPKHDEAHHTDAAPHQEGAQ